MGEQGSPRMAVYMVVDREREHQDRKWGAVDPSRPKAIATWLNIAAEELREAWDALLEAGEEQLCSDDVRREIVQCAAMLIAALEEYGAVEGHDSQQERRG